MANVNNNNSTLDGTDDIINNRSNRVRTTRRDMWSVEKQGRGGRWGVVVDDLGPFVAPTRQDARQVAAKYRNIYPRSKFRIARLTPTSSRKTT